MFYALVVCVPEKVGINKKLYFHEKKDLKWKINQPKSITLKMRGCKKKKWC
jgi:hypothetical protein